MVRAQEKSKGLEESSWILSLNVQALFFNPSDQVYTGYRLRFVEHLCGSEDNNRTNAEYEEGDSQGWATDAMPFGHCKAMTIF